MYPNLLRALFIVAVSAPSALTAVTVRPITDVGPATLQPVNPTYLTVVNPVVTTTATSKQTAVVSTPKSTSTTSKTTIIQQPPTSTTTSTTSVIISTPTPTPTTVPIDVLNGTRTTDIFATIKGIYGGLPQQVQNVTLNTTNIQCDILVGMRKQLELFLFFQIPEVPVFKKYFHTYVLPKVTSVNQILSVGTQPVVALNVAFSQRGLYKLGVQDNVFDSPFTGGQAADANNLGDPGTTNWVPQFAAGNIDGVFLIASDNITYINTFKNWLLTTLTPSGITDLYELQGNIRPPPFDGHEMFGYLDGIGQPAISGFTPAVMPGQALINAGVILTGEPGDALQSARPPWMLDGSFMAFRQLKQLVPEFNKFLLDNAPPFPGYTQQQNADLLGARIIGRWKSGTPVELSPTADNPSIGPFPNLNNNFDYTNPGFPFNTDQSHCPFGAHIRKSRPRADEPGTDINAIMRAGIPYGPEVIAAETAANTTRYERGLAFVGYQSQIAEGFQFIQTQWANNVNFAPGKSPAPGFDVIFGQNHGGPKWISGTDINNPPWVLNVLKEYVISRGGEYFFSPSISALGSPISV